MIKEQLSKMDWSKQDVVLAKLAGCTREYVRYVRRLLGKPQSDFHKMGRLQRQP